MQDKIYEMLMDEDEITWQSIIYELVKSEELDPWDINISLLSERYLKKIKELEVHNFFISGKVVLASSILLKIKSVKLVDENLAEFDSLLFQSEEDLLGDDSDERFYSDEKVPKLLVKTPQTRKRKVNLNDLMEALQKALDVENKRGLRRRDERVIREAQIPLNKADISILIKNLYAKIKEFFSKRPIVTFTELTPSGNKIDKIDTFVPLLHLENQGKIDLTQEKQFGEIKVTEHIEE
ncbi:MAG: segregation/condensation protein A [Candidatus Woesearchaeota archaeon]